MTYFEGGKINRKAFTLIELLVIIGILGILVLLAAPKFLGYTEKSKVVQIQNDIRVHEDVIQAERIVNDKFIEEWLVVDKQTMEDYRGSGGLFDKKKSLDNDYQFNDVYYKIPEGLVNTKLEGKFFLAKGGKVFYYDDNKIIPEESNNIMTKNFVTDEETNQEQIVTYNLEGLLANEDINIKLKNGKYEILSVKDEEITLKLTEGEVSRSEKTGEYIPEDTKYVTAQTSASYDKDGYKGTLNSYLYSGSYTPSHSKTESMTFQNPAWTCGGTLTAGNQSYNSGGYSGTLYYSGCSGNGYMYWSGTVTKPASDTRVYRYQGEVTKPGLDNRTTTNYYKYDITISYKGN